MAIAFSDFVQNLQYDDIPEPVLAVMRRSILDTIGVACIGRTTELSARIDTVVSRFWSTADLRDGARMIFDGRVVSPGGAAMFGAYTIDAVDAHDGYSAVKGHAGSGIFPAVMAAADYLRAQGKPIDGKTFMTALVLGYEVAYRSGLCMHATVADYHTSGAWTAVGAAAAVARMLGLDAEGIRHAAGIAEYQGPRSQMMRCIDFPSNLRDGVGWGSPTGIMSALMAETGFTGAPAITAEGADAAPFWESLGTDWEVMGTHYKPYPVCRWAHSSIDSAQDLMQKHALDANNIATVEIRTFHYATRLAGHAPNSLDEFCYSIAFPVAVMIMRGQIGVAELDDATLEDPAIKDLASRVELIDDPHYTKISTRQRWAEVTIVMKDGTRHQGAPRTPRGDPEMPLSDVEISDKFHLFTDSLIGKERALKIERLTAAIDTDPSAFAAWFELVHAPIDPR
ncbi:MmgE/PrpD family protein [Pseudorhodobacter sp. W20_MBD10_FR17]|uniref:MmgE/PrpD family protein n=1 Tax=Pseudorhodobacter sp. W20_MBD10_FR17 TaxID=3240266 RepID=UPI003F9995DB